MLIIGLSSYLDGCERVVHWPITCSPGEWRQWNWRPRDPIVIGRIGEAPKFFYHIEKGDVGWSDATCTSEPDGVHVVRESSERRMRLNIATMRFIVGSETGYRAEMYNPTFDRADIALGKCRSQDE